MELIDTHAHLDFVPEGQTADDWITRAKDIGVSKIISIGTSVEGSRKCVQIADGKSIFATVGIHAEDGRGDLEKYDGLEKCIEELKKIFNDNKDKVVGVGECGFDIRRTIDNLQLTTDQEIKFQRELFEAQIGLAGELNLPLIIHCRNGFDETLELLDSNSEKLKAKGVFHSWNGDWNAAQKALELGFYISFSGILTFKNAPLVQEVARKMPLDRVFLETDSPFLAPEPVRGSKNEPKNVKIIGEFLAELRNISLTDIVNVTSKNAGELFKLNRDK